MKKSNIIMIVGILFMIPLFFLPMWNITLEAPQYPIPLGMDIYIDHFADMHEHDIKNINLMNHYVGMKYIPETIAEFEIFPYVVGFMIIAGLLIGFKGNYKWFITWLVVMSLLGCVGMYDFYLWEYDYGHNLDPKAIMNFKNDDGSVMGFQPPLFGTKDILNFKAHSYPKIGAILMFIGMGLTAVAFLVGKKESKS